ncbi:hypothetical protein [Streptomyces sp. NPDC048361]|uniref:hypothetical protein n=1 Tax=Streptomyces sp. NPDC048361 TaxID=3154720 RepID=UPI00343EDE1E
MATTVVARGLPAPLPTSWGRLRDSPELVLTPTVRQVWTGLPAEQRANAVIFAVDYGEAGALDGRPQQRGREQDDAESGEFGAPALRMRAGRQARSVPASGRHRGGFDRVRKQALPRDFRERPEQHDPAIPIWTLGGTFQPGTSQAIAMYISFTGSLPCKRTTEQHEGRFTRAIRGACPARRESLSLCRRLPVRHAD